nr:hypothetical protein CFP56_57664 [Quercus suber]
MPVVYGVLFASYPRDSELKASREHSIMALDFLGAGASGTAMVQVTASACSEVENTTKCLLAQNNDTMIASTYGSGDICSHIEPLSMENW